jgi:glutamyl-tRNA reductase
VKNFNIIAFTHKNIDIAHVGDFHLDDDVKVQTLQAIKKELFLEEFMYLSTCNRVEFMFTTNLSVDNQFLKRFFSVFNPNWSEDKIDWAILNATIHGGIEAVQHIFNVASSLDSMVVGEREIITQVRSSYEFSKNNQLTGDFIRLLIKATIETAKEVYTQTNIAKNPVSVVSLAYRSLIDLNVKKDARILVVGAGQTNKSLTNFFHKHGYKNFTIFNRTLENAQKLANELGGEAFALSEISSYTKGFDVLLTCTASDKSIITPPLYQQLLQNEKDKKVVIDLAIPNDFDLSIQQNYPVHIIQVSSLKVIAEKNIKIREKELVFCQQIINKRIQEFKSVFKSRQVELAMSEVPKIVKEINRKAINEVFAKEINELDNHSRETLDKVLSYLEKKYISVPMKMAKDILLKQEEEQV